MRTRLTNNIRTKLTKSRRSRLNGIPSPNPDQVLYFRILEDEDFRITEDGKFRILE